MPGWQTFCLHLMPTIAAIAAGWIGLRAKKAVTEIHVQINSRMSAWMEAATEAAHAAGVNSVLAEGVAAALVTTAQAKADELLATAKAVREARSDDLLNTAKDEAVKLIATAVEAAK
jgi:hypothetical protein